MTIFYIVISVVLVIGFLADWWLARRVVSLQRRCEVGKTLRNSVNECNKRLVNHWDEAREKTLQLQQRVDKLEPALAECVMALREIHIPILGCKWQDKSYHRREIARQALERIQIPDDELPTEGYATDVP